MQREILFRGKKVKGGEWIIGDYYDKRNDGNVYLRPLNDAIIPQKVVFETVGQYTNNKDGNEVKCFEGDIVELEDGRKRLVVFTLTGFEMRMIDGSTPKDDCTSWWFKFKIIGNIHDNPKKWKN